MSFLDTTDIPGPGWRKMSDDFYAYTVSSRITVNVYASLTGELIVSAAVEPGTISGDNILEAARLVEEARFFVSQLVTQKGPEK
jgi:hypothetical protein